MASSWGHYITIPGLTVASDLSAKQYHVVKLASTAGQVVAVTASTDLAIGILHNAPDASGEAAQVIGLGVAVAVAGTSTIAEGDKVGYNTTAQVVDDVAITIGVAIDQAAAAGNQIRVLLTGM